MKLEIEGVASLCSHESLVDFCGILITPSRHQYSIKGKTHNCQDSKSGHGEEDDHTCCYDNTAVPIDLEIRELEEDPSEVFSIPHVVKSGGDNFNLSGQGVEFSTNDLLVGEKAECFISKYLSKELLGKECWICVGDMKINHEIQTLDPPI